MNRTDIIVIGAGVVGLACAYEIAKIGRDVIVLERRSSFGQETSSRNSEVVHSGIYYEKESLKARLCVEGNYLIYEFCEKFKVPYNRIGKLVVAVSKDELGILESLYEKGNINGVAKLEILTERNVKNIEPYILAYGALYSPLTGVIDTHQFMGVFQRLASEKKAVFAYGCNVEAIEKSHNSYVVHVRDTDNELMQVNSNFIINSAGLSSDKIAQMLGIDIEKNNYKLYYSKGEYFRLSPKKAGLIRKLIYPVPRPDSLGIHTVPDLNGQLRLGPNAEYVDSLNYDVDISHKEEFYNSVKKYLPFIELDDLAPDMAGIRPKLQGQGEDYRDFAISEESDKGLPGFINLIGIESPGLTSSLAIAKYVVSMLK